MNHINILAAVLFGVSAASQGGSLLHKTITWLLGAVWAITTYYAYNCQP